MLFKPMEYYMRARFKNRTFRFNDKTYPYFFHSYNNWGRKSRCIEIPIIKEYLKTYKPVHVLEIGNVSNHYYDDFKDLFISKDTVDKYEKAYDVINMDIKDYMVKKEKFRYDLVFSISTFEHMDSDNGGNPDYKPPVWDNGYSSHAMNNICHVVDDLLKPGGLFILTFPVDDNELAESLRRGEATHLHDMTDVTDIFYFYMGRVNEITWRQYECRQLLDVWDEPVFKHETICIMEIRK